MQIFRRFLAFLFVFVFASSAFAADTAGYVCPAYNKCYTTCNSGYTKKLFEGSDDCYDCEREDACPNNGVRVGSVCQDASFSITTVSNTESFDFVMSAVGTFGVSCGDDGVLTSEKDDLNGTTITRDNTSSVTYTCTWVDGPGVHTVRFAGEATDYSTYTSAAAIYFGASAKKIASISGNMSAMFPYISANAANGAQPRFYSTFANATNLTQISDTLFANYTTGASKMFHDTFSGCTGLTTIPGNLFSGITTGADEMFTNTFSGCTGLTTIPGTLFSGITTGAGSMFSNTFNGCTGLTTIPENLFSGIKTGAGYMFSATFSGCTGLTTIPGTLFSGITTGAIRMFQSTFSYCTGLTTIPGNLFSGITTGANYMFYATFSGCTGLESIPGNLFSGITTGADYMFFGTFNGCTNITRYIPPSTFAGLIANGHPTATGMWSNTFNNTQLVDECPEGMIQFITGYEGSTSGTTWNGKVSCEDCPVGIKVKIGTRLSCIACPQNATCPDNQTMKCEERYTLSRDPFSGYPLCTQCPPNSYWEDKSVDNNFSIVVSGKCTSCPATGGTNVLVEGGNGKETCKVEFYSEDYYSDDTGTYVLDGICAYCSTNVCSTDDDCNSGTCTNGCCVQ